MDLDAGTVSLKSPHQIGLRYAIITFFVFAIVSAIVIPILHPGSNDMFERGMGVGFGSMPFAAAAYAIARWRHARRG